MKLTIYHTNDIHSHLHEYARIDAYMKEHRPQLTHPSLYLDIGDHVDLSLPNRSNGRFEERGVTE